MPNAIATLPGMAERTVTISSTNANGMFLGDGLTGTGFNLVGGTERDAGRLGVLGADNAGFPNGRRPGDDVVDIELRVAMGVLCHAFPGVFCSPADAPSGNLPFTDGTLQDVSQFDDTFPYLRTPLPGSPNGPNGVDGGPIPPP